MAARAGVEPTTLRLRVIDLTNVPPLPTFTTGNVCLSDSKVVRLQILLLMNNAIL